MKHFNKVNGEMDSIIEKALSSLREELLFLETYAPKEVKGFSNVVLSNHVDSKFRGLRAKYTARLHSPDDLDIEIKIDRI